MNEIILYLAVGFILGIIFTALKLPIPAPPALAGIMGIVGVYCGYQFYLHALPKILSMF
jgi:XapX domain-containing protein